MDLGGGSVQLTWMETDNGAVNMGAKGSISLPYGAAALMKKLQKVQSSEQYQLLQQELTSEIKKALENLDVYQLLQEQSDSQSGLQLFLSGGGFRGWGYVLMSKHFIQPYPIPIINGFSVDNHQFQAFNVSSLSDVDDSTFRVSSRRSSQVPAISLLVTALTLAVPRRLKYRVHFAQGGVREGLLFSSLPSSTRSLNPLVAATSPYAPQDATALFKRAKEALPAQTALSPSNSPLTDALLLSMIQLLYVHASHPKDIRASSALRCTTTGLIAEAHGIDHQERALLALALCERWRVELPPTDHELQRGLQQLVGAEATFWAMYLGRFLHGLGAMFPAGVVRAETLQIRSTWGVTEGGEKPREPILKLELQCKGLKTNIAENWARDVEKLGKKKNWVRSPTGDVTGGFKIQCEIIKMPGPDRSGCSATLSPTTKGTPY